MHKLPLLILLTASLLLNACSGGNSGAPTDTDAHPAAWFALHAAEAAANPGYTECYGCHGIDLAGSGRAVSCYGCHAFSSAPPFGIHPASWSDTYSDHRPYAATNGYAACAGCHGRDLRGRDSVPGCYAASFDGRGCHADGPVGVPHAIDGSYRAGDAHGPEAKADLIACQACHGEIGGAGDNPRFNIGFGTDACEDCHGANYAHPADWAGPNATFHYTAGNVADACALCHGENLDGGVGVSCVGCHASVADFSLDCSFCHGYPPDGSDDLDVPTGVDHGDVHLVSFHIECYACHGMSETLSGGGFDPASNYPLFDKATETLGDHWDGNINMNSDVGYDPAEYACSACHGIDDDHRLSDSGLPVILKPYFGGN